MKTKETKAPAPRTAKVVVMCKAGPDEVEATKKAIAEGRCSRDTQEIKIGRTIDLDAPTFEALKNTPHKACWALQGARGWNDYRSPSGESLLVDAQGYDYARYIAVPAQPTGRDESIPHDVDCMKMGTPCRCAKPAPLLTLFKLTHAEGPVEILAVNRAAKLTWQGASIKSGVLPMLADGRMEYAYTDEGKLTLHTPRPAEYSDTQLVINSLEREVKTIERALRSDMDTLRRRLNEAEETLNAGRLPNTCGIVQGLSADIDMKVARLDQVRQALASIKAATENDAKRGA